MRRNGSILVIDDEEIMREILEALLTREGYTVRLASSGEEGLALARSMPFDTAIVDIMMPGIDGIATLDELKRMPKTELVAGFECSGNRAPLQGLSGNGRWTGVPLKAVLDRAGVKAQAREFVFFGADRGEEAIEWRTQTFPLMQQFGRSLNREKALSPEPMLVYALNGEPLTKHQGAPLRLLVPGWYGVANVKWLAEIHVQEDQYLGKYQARWYRTLRGEMIDGELKWVEKAVTHQQLKSFIARVTQAGPTVNVLGEIGRAHV